MPNQLLPFNGIVPYLGFRCVGDFPGYFRNIRRNASQHLPFEILNDFMPPFLPPHSRCCDFSPVLEGQDFGQVWIRIGQRFVVIGGVGGIFVSAGPGAQFPDSQSAHHILVVLLGCPLPGFRLRTALSAVLRIYGMMGNREKN